VNSAPPLTINKLSTFRQQLFHGGENHYPDCDSYSSQRGKIPLKSLFYNNLFIYTPPYTCLGSQWKQGGYFNSDVSFQHLSTLFPPFGKLSFNLFPVKQLKPVCRDYAAHKNPAALSAGSDVVAAFSETFFLTNRRKPEKSHESALFQNNNQRKIHRESSCRS
jgi:hypothetical protein